MMTGAAVSEDRPGVTYGLGLVIEPMQQFGKIGGLLGWIPGYVSSHRCRPAYHIALTIQIGSDIGMMGQEESFVEVET